MKHYYSLRYNFLMTFLMCSSTLAKIHFLYAYTTAPANPIPAYARTAALLLLFYTVINCMLFKNTLILRIMLHEFIALALSADIMYFSYFNALPSAAELQKLSLLPGIQSSIFALFKLRYLLLFADILVLSSVHFLYKQKPQICPLSKKIPAAAASILALLIMIDAASFKSSNSFQAYNNCGLLYFHIEQTAEILAKKDMQNASAGIVKNIETASKSKDAEQRYFGIAKDKNIIVIQVEALQNFLINRQYNGQELTPNLNKLIKENSFYFDRYYQHVASGGTSDAEFATQLSLYPSSPGSAYSIYVDRYLYGLPRILKDQGYSTMAFHGFKPEFWNRAKMYQAIGFDRYISGADFTKAEAIGMGINDKAFFSQTTGSLAQAKQPFYAFIVTLSSHHPYELPSKYINIRLKKEHENTLLGRYLQAINYTDAALGEFIEELKSKGLYDNSIIAFYGDHYAISMSDTENFKLMSELLGHPYSVDEMVNVPLVIHTPGMQNSRTVSVAGGQMDFMPTLLNLIGISKSQIKSYGQDLCNSSEGFAPCQGVMPKGSFIADDKVYLAASDGIFEHGKAWDYKSRRPIDLELCRSGFERAIHEMEECKYILSEDLLRPDAGKSKSGVESSLYRDFMQRLRFLINMLVE